MMIYRRVIPVLVMGIALVSSAYAGTSYFIPGMSGDFISGGLTEGSTLLTDTEINTSKIYSPEVKSLDLSENPLGTLGALQELIDQLISAADEIIKLIDSIFEMLGMEEREEVKNLKDALDDGRCLVKD
ncbi:hypothetical protein [Methanoplanus endosymbiosus]|uniref:Uncharacterized protein n=1 Tax=Methanoplanus endosymbiosus TaxID=33865 RepID=A0A9E7TL13_9EURY|nr:hypothetical protein [Methanoplanus endosymbiosus]UUX93329.1 hypothetical protein L6E24_04170 [Methanoplanus endosymbiosus]